MSEDNNHAAQVAALLAKLRRRTARKWVAKASQAMIDEVRSGETSWSPDMLAAFEAEISKRSQS